MNPVDLDDEKQRKALALATDSHQLSTQLNRYGERFVDEEEEALDLREYWRIIMRHKLTVFLVTVVAVIGAMIYTSMQTPIYRSTVKIQIDPQTTQVVEYANVESQGRGYDYFQTQYELLKSKKLAKRVIDELGLTSSNQFMAEETPSFFKDFLTSVKSLVSAEKTAVEKETTKEKDNSSQLAGMLVAGITVKPVEYSQIVNISFNSQNPKLAAKVANGVADGFINMNLERRFEASTYAKTFLEERIKQVRANLEDSEQKLIAYAGDREIIDFEQKQGGLLLKVKALNGKLVEVETRRMQAQSVFNEMQVGGDYGFTRVMENPIIQAHKQKLSEMESEYEENLRIYKPAYPKMTQLKSSIDELKEQVDQEIGNIQTAVQSDFKAAVREEAMLKARVSELKKEILDMQAGSTDFQVLKRDVDTNRELYDGLLQRMKEVDVTAGIGVNNISIVDRAEVPGSAFKPNPKKNLTVALILGLLGGIGFAFLFDHLDDTIKSSGDLEKLTGLSVMGVLPEVNVQHESSESLSLIVFDNPTSPLSEAYRSLRTALTFSTTSGSPDVLHITSCSAGEGKTTTSIALATTYVQAGANVLLIDADLRNPSLHKELNLPNEVGLTNYLAGGHKPSQVVQKSHIPKLWALTTGPIPPNPAELLASGKMLNLVTTASKKFDMVILDSPPVLGLADALILANMAQAVLLVVDAGATRTGSLEGTMQRLRQARANILGAVLTKFGQGSSGYGYDYHYSYNYYGYGADEADDEPKKKLAS